MRALLVLPALLFIASIAVSAQAPAEGEEIPPADAARLPLIAGDFWYGMYAADGQAQGFARIVVKATDNGGRHIDWTLRIAYDGGRYEEDRSLTLDAQGEMTRVEFRAGARHLLAERKDGAMVGKHGEADLQVEVKPGAVSGLGFVLAGSLQQREGASVSRHEYAEAEGMKDSGKAVLTVEKQETLELPDGEVEAWKVSMQRGRGPTLPIWVNKNREIVQVDWGHGNLMKLHHEETSNLYKPAEPTLKQLNADDKTKLQLEGILPGFSLEEMWKYWTTPEGLAAWWAPEAQVEGKVGGKYELRWPNAEGEGYRWVFLGRVTHWEEHKQLGFTWRWEHEEESEVLYVVVAFEATDGGVKLTATHSAFDESKESQAIRQGLHEGWEWFTTRLKNLKK